MNCSLIPSCLVVSKATKTLGDKFISKLVYMFAFVICRKYMNRNVNKNLHIHAKLYF